MDANNAAAVDKLVRKAYAIGQRDAVTSLKQNIDDLFAQIIEQAQQRIEEANG